MLILLKQSTSTAKLIHLGWIAGIFLMLFASGCNLVESTTDPSTPLPSPTLHPYFGTPTAKPVIINDNTIPAPPAPATTVPVQAENPTATTNSPFTAGATATPRPLLQDSGIEGEYIIMYDDWLRFDWELLASERISYTQYYWQNHYDGEVSMAVQPLGDFGTLYFTVSGESSQFFTREDVLGFSFWLSGGDNIIAPEELAVTVIGSNEAPYWIFQDTSVWFPPGDYFSETRLYDLGFNTPIPANEWYEVVVWLDDLVFDPQDYTWVTGFYIKNDEGFRQPYYVDDVNIIVAKESPTN